MKQKIFFTLMLCAAFVSEASRANAQSRSQFLPSAQDSSRLIAAEGVPDSLWLAKEPPHLQHERESLRLRRETEQPQDWFDKAAQQNAPFPTPSSAALSGEVIEAASARMDEPGLSEDHIADMLVDASGNVFVTGYSSFGPGLKSDFVTVKYNSSGVLQWRVRYNGPGDNTDQAQKLALDTFGNVYVTGVGKRGGSSWDFVTLKYNTDGVQQWVARYDGPANSHDYARDLAVDAMGNVYVVGQSVGNIIVPRPGIQEFDTDFATIKYDSRGKQKWVARYNGSGSNFDDPQALELDSRGHVYVTGTALKTDSQKNFITIKYSPAGLQEWLVRYNGASNYATGYATYLAVDDEDNVMS